MPETPEQPLETARMPTDATILPENWPRIAPRAGAGSRRWIGPWWALRLAVCDTVVIAVNTSTQDIRVQVRVYDEHGKLQTDLGADMTIGGRGQFFYRFDDRVAPERRAGWFEIVASGPVVPTAIVTDFIVYGPRDNRGGNGVQWVVPLTPA